jgi:hypothetical protein
MLPTKDIEDPRYLDKISFIFFANEVPRGSVDMHFNVKLTVTHQAISDMTMTNTRAVLIALFACWAQLSTSFTIQQPRSFVARPSRCDDVNTGSSCVVLRPTRFVPPVLQMAQAQVSGVCKSSYSHFE